MSGMTVAKLARAVGTSPDTVRYYERLGLLPDTSRSDAGYRIFGERDVERMRFIQSAQRLGFSLAEIAELLDLREHGLCPCGRARDRLTAKLPEIDEKLAALQALRDTITTVLGGADRSGRCWSCPPQILQITPRPEEDTHG
jgi:DNA-binding transcriptional MerR regulator